MSSLPGAALALPVCKEDKRVILRQVLLLEAEKDLVRLLFGIRGVVIVSLIVANALIDGKITSLAGGLEHGLLLSVKDLQSLMHFLMLMPPSCQDAEVLQALTVEA